MKKFIIKTLLFASCLFIMDFVCGYFLQTQRLSDYKQFLDSKISFFDFDKDVDILILGDSHVADAIDTRTLEANLKLTAYNMGVYHASPFETYFIAKAALAKQLKKPKLILLGTNPIMFEKALSKGKYTPLILSNNIELSYYSDEGFDASFFFKSFREKYLFKLFIKKLKGDKYKPTRIVEDVYHGHLKFYNQTPKLVWNKIPTVHKKSGENPKQVEYFIKTIKLALENNIPVIIVNPPIWQENLNAIEPSDSYQKFVATINESAKKFNLKVYEMNVDCTNSTDILILPQKDFLNTQHLNYLGSKVFTKQFCDYLKKQGYSKSNQ